MKQILALIAVILSGSLFFTATAQAGSASHVRVKLDRHHGYYAVKTTRRKGRVYRYTACKRNKHYKLRVNRKGRILRRRHTGACPVHKRARKKARVRVSAPYTRVKVRGRNVKVRAPYTRVKVKGRKVKVRAPYTKVKVKGHKVRVDAPYTHVRVKNRRVHVVAPYVNLRISY